MRKPSDIADRHSQRGEDGFVRQRFRLPRGEARQAARKWLDRYPAAAYSSSVEAWRELPNDVIEFTMKRLPSSD
jgi:hypothetical protein